MEEHLTLGVEEEFQLVHPTTLELVSGYDTLVRPATAEILQHIHPEFYQCVVEGVTDVCSSVDDARIHSMAVRATIIQLAHTSHLEIISSGSHPNSHWEKQKRTTDAAGRYAGIERLLQDVARTLTICGLHVHVGIADEALRIQVINQVRTYLPYVLALSANSPFWLGRRTGYQSFRTMVWAPFPLANMPDAFDSLDEYARFRTLLERTGTTAAPRRIWWDIRSHFSLPTVEFRIADMPMTHAETITIVAYIQALVKTITSRTRDGKPLPVLPTAVINENKWRAARWALRAQFIDYDRQIAVPATELIHRSLDLIGPAAAALGTTAYLDKVRGMLDANYLTGAERQLRAYDARHDIRDVGRLLVEQTKRGIEMERAMPQNEKAAPLLSFRRRR